MRIIGRTREANVDDRSQSDRLKACRNEAAAGHSANGATMAVAGRLTIRANVVDGNASSGSRASPREFGQRQRNLGIDGNMKGLISREPMRVTGMG